MTLNLVTVLGQDTKNISNKRESRSLDLIEIKDLCAPRTLERTERQTAGWGGGFAIAHPEGL